MTHRGKGIFKTSIAVVAVAAGIGYFAFRRSASDTPIVFKTGTVDRGPVVQLVTATGALSAVVTVQVGSQVSGIIMKLGADFNSQVKEGQIIAQLDPTRFRASLEQANASLKNAEAASARARVNFEQAKLDFDRATKLGAQAVVGQAEMDQMKSKLDLTKVEVISSEAQVAQARASVGMARVDLERTTIRAPIDGTVLQRAVDVGQTVAASMQAPTLFIIAQDLSHMEVRAAIDESDVGKLREGMDARFTVDAHPGQEFAATVFQIRSQPNVQSNVVTYDAMLRVDNPEGKLRPGMTANVRIVCERREGVIRIPNAALRFKPAPEMILASQVGPAGGPLSGPGGGAGGGGKGDGGVPGGGWGERRRGGGRDGAGREGGGAGPGGAGRRGEGGGRMFARVYKAAGEKVSVVQFKPGISDDEFTEVLSGPLTAGDSIVLEATGGAMSQQPAAGSRPNTPGGGAGRGRGPRMF